MPSQLYNNKAISFIAARNFTYGSEKYELGDDFPQEEANNIETLIRARYVVAVVDDIKDKPRHWHTHIRTREEALEWIRRDRVQLVMPTPPDSNEVVNLDVLTHPELTPEPSDEPAPVDHGGPEVGEDAEFDPSEHTVVEVENYLEEHPEDRDRVLELEASPEGRQRKGLLED